MKKLKLFALCLVAVSLMFTGCSDDDNNGGNGGGGGTGGTNDSYIEGTISNWQSHDLDSVYLVLYWENENRRSNTTLSSSAVTNGTFKLALPSTIADEYLHGFYFDEEDADINISDLSALINMDIDIEAFKDGTYIGDLEYLSMTGNETSGTYNEMYYVYANKAVKITGTEEYEEDYDDEEYYEKITYNVNLAKGWNKVYEKTTYTSNNGKSQEITEITTTPISGLKWYLDTDWEDNIYEDRSMNMRRKQK